MLSTYTPTNREAISIFVSQATDGLASWLFSALFYNRKDLRVEDKDFFEAIRIRMLLPTHDDATVLPRCNSCKIDNPSLYHGYCCRKLSGAYIGRHNRVVRAVAEFAKACTTSGVVDVLIEERVGAPQVGDRTCRADIALHWGNSVHYVDVQVCSCTSSTSLLGRFGAINPNVPPSAGWAIAQAENSKFVKYANRHDLERHQLTPFVLDMTGRLGHQANEFVNKLSKIFGDHHDAITISDERLKTARKNFIQRLGVELVRGNGHMVRKYHHFLQTGM